MEKRVGAATHPCLTAVQMGNESVSEPLQRTVAVIPSWSSLSTVMNFGGQPYLASIFHRASRLTVSKAFVRLIKAKKRS